MKVFLSWSGERSRQVAELLDTWIQCVIQAIDPWVSSQDIDRGALWFSEISNQLANTTHGIICLTKENKEKPWILFEAGALAKGLSSSRVFTFLIDLKPEDIKDPLAQFNHTLPNRDSIYKLVATINNSLLDNKLEDKILNKVFNTYWPQLESDFKEIIKRIPSETKEHIRPQEDILFEVLNSIRNVDRRLRIIEVDKNTNNVSESNMKLNLRKVSESVLTLSKIRSLVLGGLSDDEIISQFKHQHSSEWIYNKVQEIRDELNDELKRKLSEQ